MEIKSRAATLNPAEEGKGTIRGCREGGKGEWWEKEAVRETYLLTSMGCHHSD